MAASPVVFLKEVKTELTKVVWPTRAQTIKFTFIVIAISLILGAYIGGLDLLFTKLTDILIKR
ncbi:preprotein translocase subunit SecE [Candidatus Gottesmanbacteria bacterium]|nr:preprotein translocase subunit SecE [Candidatus Gottesmanbacteria bacterium]